MCVVCTMSINMQKQTAIAAKQMKADLATNIDRSRKQQLKDKMADKLAQKGKKIQVIQITCHQIHFYCLKKNKIRNEWPKTKH